MCGAGAPPANAESETNPADSELPDFQFLGVNHGIVVLREDYFSRGSQTSEIWICPYRKRALFP